jgi:hypothetical protein
MSDTVPNTLFRFSTMPKNLSQNKTPVVLVNSNAHGQIKSDENYNLDLVDRRKFPDMTILEINIARPGVVNILDDETVHLLHRMINRKINAIKGKILDPDYNANLITALTQADVEYKVHTTKIIKDQVLDQIQNLINILESKLVPPIEGELKSVQLESFTDENEGEEVGNSIIEQIRDRIHFVNAFLQNDMFDYIYFRDNPDKKMLKVYFSGDELTNVPQNWRIIAEELYNVPTTLPTPENKVPTVHEIIQQSQGVETNYIIGNSVDLLRYLPSSTKVTRNGAQQLSITNEDIYEYLYNAGYRKVIMFNNSCATAIDVENNEITDLRTLRRLRKEADNIRRDSVFPLNISKLRPSKEINSFDTIFISLKKELEEILNGKGYTIIDAKINIHKGGSKSKSNRNQRSNKKSKRKNNRKTYKKKLRKTYKKRR